MASRRVCCRWPRRCLAGDSTREGGTFGDDREDRPERCPRDRPIAADGLVSTGSCKSVASQDTRAVLVGRKLLQGKLLDVELSIRGILRGYGLKFGEVSRGRFEARIQELIAGHATLETVIGAMLLARMTLWGEFTRLHREMLKIARADKICHRLMSTPGVGALVALTHIDPRSTIRPALENRVRSAPTLG